MIRVLLLLSVLLVGCETVGNNQPSDVSNQLHTMEPVIPGEHEKSNDNLPEVVETVIFPESMKLTYESIELEPLTDARSIDDGWELQAAYSFGEVSGESITMDLYANIEESDNGMGLLHFKDNSYIIKPIGYGHDIESIAAYPIQNQYSNTDQDINLIGAIGAPALGYQYILYDGNHDEWLIYHNWGRPALVDIDGDGVQEVFMQFEGMGNNFPDISILSWKSGTFRIAGVNEGFNNLVSMSSSRIYTELSDIARPEITVTCYGNEEEASAVYSFAGLDTLLRLDRGFRLQ